jgi:chromosome segregation ATPase
MNIPDELTQIGNTTPADLLEPVEPMTVTEALAERDKLTAQLGELAAAGRKRNERIKEIDAEIAALQKADGAALQRAAADGTAPGESPAPQIAQLEEERQRLEKTTELGKGAMRNVKQAIHYLHIQQADAFTEHAESLAAEAVEALTKIRRPYESAYAAWATAKAEIDRQVEHHHQARQPGGTYLGRDKSRIAPQQAPAPPCPLPSPGTVFSAAPPRPQVPR